MNPDALTTLAEEIRAAFQGATTEIEKFPSGAIMLNVRWRDKLYVLGYVGDRWGVDVVREGTGFDTALAVVALDYDDGCKHLLRLMNTR